MNDWFYSKITDYWDQQVDAIAVSAASLRALSDEQRKHALSDLDDAVLQHIAVLSSRGLINAAIAMADDLYKAASADLVWDDATESYLRMTAEPLAHALAERDFDVRYVINNTYEPTEHGLTRPLTLFPVWFQAAGFVYICPQHLVMKLAEADGIEGLRDVVSVLPRYIDEARYLANEIVRKAQAGRRHYLYLDTDSIAASFDCAAQSDPNAIIILRDAAPEPGSEIQVTYPTNVGD
jgi:hypothetical protein